MEDELYQARILDHARHPRNKGVLRRADASAKAANISCGDRLTLYLAYAGRNIRQAMFEGEGCAISQAAASLLTERLVGCSHASARKLTEDDVIALLGVPISSARRGCALLACSALQHALARA
jgi:nitrogen fixation NifU-like protein